MVKGKIEKILISREEIAKRVQELGKQITEDYRGQDLLVVGILKGAVVFFADLCRAIDLPLEIDFMALSSYASGTTSSGNVKILKDLDRTCEGKHILVVEDIIDSGYTMRFLKKFLADRHAASIKVCSLLDKPERRRVEMVTDYCGFVIPDAFVVGYGLDYAQYYRNLPDIAIVDPGE